MKYSLYYHGKRCDGPFRKISGHNLGIMKRVLESIDNVQFSEEDEDGMLKGVRGFSIDDERSVLIAISDKLGSRFMKDHKVHHTNFVHDCRVFLHERTLSISFGWISPAVIILGDAEGLNAQEFVDLMLDEPYK